MQYYGCGLKLCNYYSKRAETVSPYYYSYMQRAETVSPYYYSYMYVRLSLASLSLSYNLLLISMQSLSDTQSSARRSRNAVTRNRVTQMRQIMSRRQWRKLYCPHCNEMVTKTTFYIHKRSFYNPRSKQWARSNITGMSRG